MADQFEFDNKKYDITIYPGPDNKKPYPIIVVLHGIVGLDDVFLPEMKTLAAAIAARGYVTAVPGYFPDNSPPQSIPAFDPKSYRETLLAAVDHIASRHPNADRTKLGLVGYSFGGATAMTYIATDFAGKIVPKVLVDFFGPTLLFEDIFAGIAKFPPTIIFHNENDDVVKVVNSRRLDARLTVEHELHVYDEHWPPQRNHPFEPGKPADLESRKRAVDWIVAYLPPP